MENASKALLIAAGMLLAVMLLSLLFVFWDNVAGYFTAQHDATMLKQLIEFNNKYQNYDGKTIRGNELVSIMNSIVDYNNYQSDMEGYEPIKIKISFKDETGVNHDEEMEYGNENVVEDLIPDSYNGIIKNYTNEADTTINDTIIEKIAETSSRLVSHPDFSSITGLTDTKLQKMSANIEHIVDDEDDVDVVDRDEYLEEYIKYRQQLLTRILGAKNVKAEDDSGYSQWIGKIKSATYHYYQYTMFKRAMFECTKVSYNETNGRVNKMEFQVIFEDNGMGKQIKFD